MIDSDCFPSSYKDNIMCYYCHSSLLSKHLAVILAIINII